MKKITDVNCVFINVNMVNFCCKPINAVQRKELELHTL